MITEVIFLCNKSIEYIYVQCTSSCIISISFSFFKKIIVDKYSRNPKNLEGLLEMHDIKNLRQDFPKLRTPQLGGVAETTHLHDYKLAISFS